LVNRFWIGNGGTWIDTAHWSDTDGGAGGFSVPTYGDTVRFTANSFSIDGQSVTGGNCLCGDIDFTGVTNSPHFNVSNLYLTGSPTFISAMQVTIGTMEFRYVPVSATLVITILAPNKAIGAIAVEVYANADYDVYLGSDINMPNCGFALYHDGIFDTANYDITAKSFNTNTGNPQIIFGTSTVVLYATGGSPTYVWYTPVGTFSVENSNVTLSGAGTGVRIQGPVSGIEFGDLITQAAGMSILTSITANTLTIKPDTSVVGYSTIKIKEPITANEIITTSTNDHKLDILPYTAATPYEINLNNAVEVEYCRFSYCDATGETIYAVNSVDSGNNVNVIFGAMPVSGFNIFLGATQVDKIYLGTTEITEAYLGSQTLK
jgi:hypothetical protein